MDNNYEGGQKILEEVIPEEMTFSTALGEPGAFSATCKMPKKSQSVNSKLLSLLPYYYDWRVARADLSTVQFGGIIDEVEYNFVDRTVRVAGKDYMGALDNRMWYFDPADPVGNWYPQEPGGMPRSIDLVVQDLITNTFSRTASVPISFASSISGTPPTIFYSIGPADSETIYSKIKALSEQADGFDFSVDYNRVFRLYYPSKGTTRTLRLENGFNMVYNGVKITEGGSNRVIAIGQTPDNRAGSVGVVSGYPTGGYSGGTGPRTKEVLIDLGDVDDAKVIKSFADGEARRQTLPLREMDVDYVVNPREVLWSSVVIGDTINVIGNQDISEPTATKRVVSIECNVDSSGVEKISLGLDEPAISL